MEERIKQAEAVRVLNQEEADQLKAFEQLRREIIQVNEFSFDLNEVVT